MKAVAAERIRHRFFARLYPRISRAAEARGGAQHRRELLAGLSGRVIEVGTGNGLNFRYYPTSVQEVAYRVRGLPTSHVGDRDGFVRFREIGYRDWADHDSQFLRAR